MKTFLLIDGHAMIHRAFHALPPLTNKDGIPTNAIYGFFAMIHKAIADFRPHYVIVCFDTPKPTFRKDLFSDYQAKRPPMDDTLKPQIAIIKDLLDKAGIPRLEKEGYEADDVIGTLVATYKSEAKILILTGDKDILQLVDNNVSVIVPQTGMSSIKIYSPEEVMTKMGVEPQRIPDYKALVGDPSDNYQTAKGIGPKTALKLLAQFKTIEDIFARIDTVENEKIKTILMEYKDKILLFKQLATIVTNIKIDLNIIREFNNFAPAMRTELEKYQLFAIIKRVFPREAAKDTPQKTPHKPHPKEVKDNQIRLF